jgi:hypothetical protein
VSVIRAVVRGSWAVACTLSILVGGLVACGADGPVASDPRALRGDGEALTRLLASDPAQPVLDELDGMIEDRLPVRAAGHIRTAALPAVRRQRERVGAAVLRTAEGRALQERAVRACRRRAESLDSYAAALARGEVEDGQLLEAVRAHRAAELEVLAALDAARALAQPAAPEPAKGVAAPRVP